MREYAINKEFNILKGMKLPANPKLLPPANAFLEIMRGRTDSKVKVEKMQISGYKGERLPVYVIEPKESVGITPCLVDYHGGGFMMKGSPAHFSRAKEYACRLKCKVIFPDYRLIPKHPYPVPAEDCFAAYKWVIEHRKELEVDVNRMAVLGDSAGGCLAAATTLMARDRGLPLPCYQMLIYPVLDRRMETESMKNYTDTPVWDACLSKLMWDLYLNGQEIEAIEYASPAEVKNLTGVPATYIEVAEFDSLCDEGIAFAQRLEEEGGVVELHKVSGAVHGYDTVRKSKIVKKLMQRRINWMKKEWEG